MKKYFYKGKHVIIVSPLNNGQAIVSVAQDFNPTDKFPVAQELFVKVNEMQQVCDEAFELYDKVNSNIGDLTGWVSGFEHQTNRVVVTSDRVRNYRDNRTRYAYLMSEIEKVPEVRRMYEFERGNFYKLNSEITVHAIEQPGEPELVTLVDIKGRVRLHDVPKKVDAIGFEMSHGINNVQETKGWRK